MIVIHESTAHGMCKPVICPKCENGKLGYIPRWSDAVISRRGKAPPGEQGEGVQVKCHVCRKLWTITIE